MKQELKNKSSNKLVNLFVRLFGCGLSILLMVTTAQAKELELILENTKSDYPITMHYKFSSENQIYGSGGLRNVKKGEKYFIYVNRVPDDKIVKIQIDKISVGHRIVFNDPCEIQLSKNDLQANIVVGFEGDPETHGSFTCFVSAPKMTK